MKITQTLFAAILISSAQCFAVNMLSQQVGDDGDPNTQGNGGYIKHEASSTPKASSKPTTKKISKAGTYGLFKTQATTILCIKDGVNKVHTLEVSNMSKSGWPDKEFIPTIIFANRKVRTGRTTCGTLIIGGNAEFSLLVDGVPVPMQILERLNNFADPSDVSYVWSAKMGGSLTGGKIITNGYVSGILDGSTTTFTINK